MLFSTPHTGKQAVQDLQRYPLALRPLSPGGFGTEGPHQYRAVTCPSALLVVLVCTAIPSDRDKKNQAGSRLLAESSQAQDPELTIISILSSRIYSASQRASHCGYIWIMFRIQGLADASFRGDERWRNAAKWTGYAPWFVLAICILSMTELALGFGVDCIAQDGLNL